MIEEILTGMIVKNRTLKSAKWEEGKGKKVQYFITKRIIQSKTIGGGSHSPELLYAKNTMCRAGRPKNIIMWNEGQEKI